ncbi:serine protease [Roseimaritima sediminicola]|uniref:serine protease n=1 Tax=Roseimaritima sediminicola TaxID=2662066 RepID=UPI00129834CF|nr:serine protease [Roseimaritima sediminicola]
MKRLIPAVAALLCAASFASAAQPVISRLEPLGVRRGEATKVIVHGARLKDARQVLADLPGLTIEGVKPLDNAKVEMTVTADASLAPGLYPLRLVTETGITNLRLLGVGAMPVVQEVEPNSDFDTPQKIELNTTVEGVITTEDQDLFAVELKAGQTLVAEIEGVRLASDQRNRFLDPYIAILDEGRFEKATRDDIPLLQQDGLCSYTAETDGTYTVLVRDASFGGSNDARYRVHIGSYPRPVAVVPGGGRPGEVLTADLVNLDGSKRSAQIQLPSEPNDRFPAVSEDENGVSPSPNYIRVNDLPVAMEEEPNESLQKAPVVSVPGALCGVIGTPGDVDYFAFEAVKGRKYIVQMYARNILRSPLDSVVNIYGPDSKRVTGNDDTGGMPDSYCEFTAAADGLYRIRINDQLGNGGPEFGYRLEVTEAKPEVTLSLAELDRDQAVVWPVPRGGQMAVMVNAARKHFGGELNIEALNLPEGITATVFPMRSDRSTVPLLLSAAAEAPGDATLANLVAQPTDEKLAHVRGHLIQEHKLVLGQNRRHVWNWETKGVAVSVAEPMPFRLTVEQPQVPVVRSGSMSFKVKVERDEGYEGVISLQTLYNPPGVSVNNSRKLAKDVNEIEVPLTANGSAATGTWPMFLIATADVGNGSARITSTPISLDVQDVFFRFEFPKSAAEQGTENVVAVGVEVTREFEGEAEVELVGMPPGVSSPEPIQKITAETEQVSFPIKIAEDARPGTHKTLNVRARIKSDKGVITQTQGTGELRVDEPLPPKKDEPEEKPKEEKKPEAKPEPPKERPLSRLEQLRKARAEQ